MKKLMIPKILIIAGLDPSGNAGVLRDLEIVHSFGLKPSCVITALTAQNKKKFISAQVVSKTHFQEQLKAVSPLSQYKAIKIGMLGNEGIVQSLVSFLENEKKIPPLILDPVYQSSTGGTLLTQKGKDLLWKRLIPLVTLWTPNIYEASYFSGLAIKSDEVMERAGEILWREKKTPVLIKGRHSGNEVKDFYFDGGKKRWFVYPRVGARHTVLLRGTGCALSSIIASYFIMEKSLPKAVMMARKKMDIWIRSKPSPH